ELEAQPQEEAALEHPARDARVPDGTEQDRVVAADGREVLVGEGLAGAVPAGRPEVVRGGADGDVLPRDGGVEDLEALGDDFLTDAVPGDHCKVDGARHARHPTGASAPRDGRLTW